MNWTQLDFLDVSFTTNLYIGPAFTAYRTSGFCWQATVITRSEDTCYAMLWSWNYWLLTDDLLILSLNHSIYIYNYMYIKLSCIYVTVLFRLMTINITRHRDRSALRHLPALNNKRNYCIQAHLYLFSDNVYLSIGLTIMHIYNWPFQSHVNCNTLFGKIWRKITPADMFMFTIIRFDHLWFQCFQ